MKSLLLMMGLLLSYNTTFAKDCDCNGYSGTEWTNNRHRNPSAGGCVSDGAYVDERVFIAPSAKVCGDNIIEGENIKIIGNARIIDTAEIKGNNILIGRGAVIGGTAQILSNMEVISEKITSGRHQGKRLNGIDRAQAEKERAEEERAKKAIHTKKLNEIIAVQNEIIAYVTEGVLKFPKVCGMERTYSQSSKDGLIPVYKVNLRSAEVKEYLAYYNARYAAIVFEDSAIEVRKYDDYGNLEKTSSASEVGFYVRKEFKGDVDKKLKSMLVRLVEKCQAL